MCGTGFFWTSRNSFSLNLLRLQSLPKWKSFHIDDKLDITMPQNRGSRGSYRQLGAGCIDDNCVIYVQWISGTALTTMIYFVGR